MELAEIIGWIIATSLVAITVLIHYEIMLITSDKILPWGIKRFHDRRVMLMTITMLMIAHIIEIWVFAFVVYFMYLTPKLGYLSGEFDGSLSACVYFSAVSYTSLGYGEIIPRGAIRNIAVSEALIGLLMIAWSASFTYIKMEQTWNERRKKIRHPSAE
ncbi:MAG: potassium channel family protein [Alphaproteobacteria bacterium]